MNILYTYSCYNNSFRQFPGNEAAFNAVKSQTNMNPTSSFCRPTACWPHAGFPCRPDPSPRQPCTLGGRAAHSPHPCRSPCSGFLSFSCPTWSHSSTTQHLGGTEFPLNISQTYTQGNVSMGSFPRLAPFTESNWEGTSSSCLSTCSFSLHRPESKILGRGESTCLLISVHGSDQSL